MPSFGGTGVQAGGHIGITSQITWTEGKFRRIQTEGRVRSVVLSKGQSCSS